jgi:hypothetical protein
MNFSESDSVGLKSQAFGQRSRQHLSDLVFGRQVELHTRGLDRYGLVSTSTSNRYAAAWRGFTIGMLSRPAPISRRATGKPRLKHRSRNADSGVNPTLFRRGNVGVMPGKQSKLPAIQGLKAKVLTMPEGSRHTKAGLLRRHRNIALALVGKINMVPVN